MGEKNIRISLDKKLSQCGITRYELAKRTGITFAVIDKYYKNKVVRYDKTVLLKICLALDCAVSDIIEII